MRFEELGFAPDTVDYLTAWEHQKLVHAAVVAGDRGVGADGGAARAFQRRHGPALGGDAQGGLGVVQGRDPRRVSLGVDVGKPVITTCGSGVTAAIVGLALETLGRPARALYDGSWSEWGNHPDTPAEKSE